MHRAPPKAARHAAPTTYGERTPARPLHVVTTVERTPCARNHGRCRGDEGGAAPQPTAGTRICWPARSPAFGSELSCMRSSTITRMSSAGVAMAAAMLHRVSPGTTVWVATAVASRGSWALAHPPPTTTEPANTAPMARKARRPRRVRRRAPRDWIGTELRELIGTELRELIGTELRELIGTELRELIGTELRELIGTELRELIGTELRELIGTELRELIGTELRELIGTEPKVRTRTVRISAASAVIALICASLPPSRLRIDAARYRNRTPVRRTSVRCLSRSDQKSRDTLEHMFDCVVRLP